MTGSFAFIKFVVASPILNMEGAPRMTKRQSHVTIRERGNDDSLPRTFTPVNRRKDGAVLRQIRDRIREGYYESTEILKRIADKIVSMK
ncbi:hypothetical protein HUU59_00715 [bacterium]|nr:hypothetical protein [bacterium]